MPFNSVTITINPGTAVPVIPTYVPTYSRCIRITMLHAAGCLVGYLLNGKCDYGTVLTKSAQTLVTEIAPASATAPGTMIVLERRAGQAPFDVSEFQIDGSHADTVQVSWDPEA